MIKKAQKLNIEGCKYTVDPKPIDKPFLSYINDKGQLKYEIFQGSQEALKVREDRGEITYRRYFEVTISGPAPVLDGWEFVAALEHLTDDKGQPLNVIRCRPSFEGNLPTVYCNAPCKCDHCKTNRNRKASCVVRNVTTGEWKQVGLSCVKDFCGGNDPRQVACLLEWDLEAKYSEEDLDGEGGYGHSEMRWSLREFLATTCAVIRTQGWLSRGKATGFGPPPTVDLVMELLSK
jgi:hypothetical protein